jgi:peptidoglycan/LPS O-acetylase OafA/YrhL
MGERQLNLNIQQLRGIAVISVVLFHLNFVFAKTG